VLSPPVRACADTVEPLALLKRHHDAEPSSSLTTALLLLSDRRWRGGIAQLVRRIASSSLLESDQLDVLAETFIVAGDAVYWRLPDAWLADEPVMVDIAGDELAGSGLADTDHGPVVARRDIAPPLRRWAAGRRVGQRPEDWASLWRRAGELDPRGGAALAMGVLDRLDAIARPAQEFLVTEARSWPDHGVRRLALEYVAARHGSHVAAQLGENDPNARIRRWAADLLTATEATAAGERNGDSEPAASSGAQPAHADQPTLF